MQAIYQVIRPERNELVSDRETWMPFVDVSPRLIPASDSLLICGGVKALRIDVLGR